MRALHLVPAPIGAASSSTVLAFGNYDNYSVSRRRDTVIPRGARAVMARQEGFGPPGSHGETGSIVSIPPCSAIMPVCACWHCELAESLRHR